MPQTVGGTSFSNAYIAVSANGSAWTDISGQANQVKPGGGARMVGQAYTALGDTAIVTAGKREPIELDVGIVYTEIGAEAFETLRAIFEAGTAYYVRYAPKGNVSTNKQFTTDAGFFTDMFYPDGDVSKAEPIMVTFKHKSPKLTESAIP